MSAEWAKKTRRGVPGEAATPQVLRPCLLLLLWSQSDGLQDAEVARLLVGLQLEEFVPHFTAHEIGNKSTQKKNKKRKTTK